VFASGPNAGIQAADGWQLRLLTSSGYLGLSSHWSVMAAAHAAARFICGIVADGDFSMERAQVRIADLVAITRSRKLLAT
jgi:hypothetical protein